MIKVILFLLLILVNTNVFSNGTISLVQVHERSPNEIYLRNLAILESKRSSSEEILGAYEYFKNIGNHTEQIKKQILYKYYRGNSFTYLFYGLLIKNPNTPISIIQDIVSMKDKAIFAILYCNYDLSITDKINILSVPRTIFSCDIGDISDHQYDLWLQKVIDEDISVTREQVEFITSSSELSQNKINYLLDIYLDKYLYSLESYDHETSLELYEGIILGIAKNNSTNITELNELYRLGSGWKTGVVRANALGNKSSPIEWLSANYKENKPYLGSLVRNANTPYSILKDILRRIMNNIFNERWVHGLLVGLLSNPILDINEIDIILNHPKYRLEDLIAKDPKTPINIIRNYAHQFENSKFQYAKFNQNLS